MASSAVRSALLHLWDKPQRGYRVMGDRMGIDLSNGDGSLPVQGEQLPMPGKRAASASKLSGAHRRGRRLYADGCRQMA